MESISAVSKLSALAQASRLQVFRHLVQLAPEPVNAGDIAEALGIAKATLSFHLKELSQAELITPSQQGRHIYYSPNLRAMDALMDYLFENCCQGEGCASQRRTVCDIENG